MGLSSDRLVVIGASAGGVGALRQLASALPADLPASVLIVLHVGAHESILPQLIAADCALPVSHAVDGEALRAGTIRIAPPDRHLMVADGRLRLTRGPKENFARPAIDPLFRSAALDFGPKVIGVILTGMLDDGTAGLQAVKAGGGIAIVQDPADAHEPSMPASADSASAQVRSWIASRPPTSSRARAVATPGPTRPTCTVPAGCPSWRSGPATPVVPMPQLAPVAAAAPRAIARAHSDEITPYCSTRAGETPSSSSFTEVA
jgi:hypothetical protein